MGRRILLMRGGNRSYVDEYDTLSPALTVLNTGAAVGVAGGVLKATTLADVLPNLVVNGNMETGSPPTGWSTVASSVLSSVADERTGGAGSKSLNVVRGSSNFSASSAISPLTGATATLSAWVKSISGAGLSLGVYEPGTAKIFSTDTSASLTWAALTTKGVFTATGTLIFLNANNARTEGQFDDVSLYIQAALVNDARLTGVVNGLIGRTIAPPASPSVVPYGFWLRNDGTGLNGIRVRLTPNTAGLDTEIWQVVAGVATSRASADADWATGDTCWVEMRGAIITVYRQAAGSDALTQLCLWTAATTPGPYNGEIFYGTSWGVSRLAVRA